MFHLFWNSITTYQDYFSKIQRLLGSLLKTWIIKQLLGEDIEC